MTVVTAGATNFVVFMPIGARSGPSFRAVIG